jgi:hypothetical protein
VEAAPRRREGVMRSVREHRRRCLARVVFMRQRNYEIETRYGEALTPPELELLRAADAQLERLAQSLELS